MPPYAESNTNLCEYEMQRETRIRRNQEELRRLGIEDAKKSLPPKAKSGQKRSRATPAVRAPGRSSSRVAAQASKGEDVDYDPENSDFEGDEDDDDDDDEEPYQELPKPRRVSVKKLKADTGSPAAETESEEALVRVENAKTGRCGPSNLLWLYAALRCMLHRSKCRKCMEPLPEGVPRVGMQAH